MVEKSSSADTNGLGGLGGTCFEKGRAIAERARRLIPGGAHTYAKGDDQYPVLAPPVIVRGKGCRIWDADGNQYIEYGMGLRAVTLGHAYAPVVDAVRASLDGGCNFNRPAPVEIECAEKFLDLVPSADMVKFCKDGSTAVDAAIRIARSVTARDYVAICGDHPFFSTSDWFIGTTGMPGGIPEWVRSRTLKFSYNKLETVQALFSAHPGQIACVLLEAVRTEEPAPGFLPALLELCHREGALLVFDEMITGFRFDNGGAQRRHGVTPDLSSFGKALANGFSVSALAGSREYMQVGGMDHDRERVFVLSTTHGAETHSLAAAIATMRVYETEPVIEHIRAQGGRLRRGVEQAIDQAGVRGHFSCVGLDPCLLFGTADQSGQPSQVFRALFMQEMIKRGVLAPSFAVSYSHSDDDIDRTVEAVAGSLAVYRQALDEGADRFLIGRPVKPVFRPRA